MHGLGVLGRCLFVTFYAELHGISVFTVLHVWCYKMGSQIDTQCHLLLLYCVTKCMPHSISMTTQLGCSKMKFKSGTNYSICLGAEYIEA